MMREEREREAQQVKQQRKIGREIKWGEKEGRGAASKNG